MANQPLVANPKIKAAKAEIKELEYRLTQQKQQLATWLLRLKNKNVSIAVYEKRQRKTVPKLQALEQLLESRRQQLQALPEPRKAGSIIEALTGGRLSACDLEKKKLYDVIQIVAYNAEQMLLKIFQKYYPWPAAGQA